MIKHPGFLEAGCSGMRLGKRGGRGESLVCTVAEKDWLWELIALTPGMSGRCKAGRALQGCKASRFGH